MYKLKEKKKKEKESAQNDQKKKIDKYIDSVPFQYLTLDNNETLCYRIFGKSKQNYVIFIHGNLSAQRHWDPLFQHLLQDENYTFVTLDMRGYGRSSYNNPIQNLEDFADDLKMFVDELKIKQFMLVGWSFGGGVAMQFCIKYPSQVQKLILVSSIHHQGYPPFMYKDPETKQLVRIKDLAIIRSKSKRINKNILDKDKEFLKIFYGSMLVRSKKEWFQNQAFIDIIYKETFMQKNYIDSISAQHIFDISDKMNQICCPVLIYHGDTDVLIPIEKAKHNASVIKRNIGRENCVLIIKKDCGHAVIYEHPKDFSRTLLTFANLNFKQPKPKF